MEAERVFVVVEKAAVGAGDGGGEVGGGGESASAAVRVAEGGRSSKDRVLLI